ncbi:MAG: DUF2284 domain-containing protein [Clostridia bacterium]|nr:DUF2284 domain-containing protein [Clostridia bacterium]
MQNKIFVRECDGYTVFRMEQITSVEDYLSGYVDVPKFEALCRSCPNYGRKWSCPPFGTDPMEIWKKYNTLRLIAHILVPKDGTTGMELLAAHEEEKNKLRLWLTAYEEAHPKSLALWAGTCDLCGRCAKIDGEPCRFPEQMRHSIEALGGDVGKTAADYFDHPIQWITENQTPAYMTLMGGLLYNGI